MFPLLLLLLLLLLLILKNWISKRSGRDRQQVKYSHRLACNCRLLSCKCTLIYSQGASLESLTVEIGMKYQQRSKELTRKDDACSINSIYERSYQSKITSKVRRYSAHDIKHATSMRGRTKSPKSVSFSFGLFHLRHSKMLKTVRNYNSNSGLVAIRVPRPGKEYCPVNPRWFCTRRFETMIPTMLEPCCDNLKQCRSNVTTLFCAENCVWESPHVHSIIVFTNVFSRICKNQLPYLVALICAIQMD